MKTYRVEIENDDFEMIFAENESQVHCRAVIFPVRATNG